MDEKTLKDSEKYVEKNYVSKEMLLTYLDRLYYTTQIPKTPMPRKKAYEVLKNFINGNAKWTDMMIY